MYYKRRQYAQCWLLVLDGPDAITITVAVAVDKKTADEGRS
jgi:hypothetical protein